MHLDPTPEGGNLPEPSRPPTDPPVRTGSGRRLLVAALALVVIAGTATAIYFELRPPPPPQQTLAFFTIDEGKTWFTADAESLPPFDYHGHKAVKAHLYTCDGGKTRFVGWLQKLPEDALQEALAKGPVDDDVIAMKAGWMAKRPGDAEWVNSKTDPQKYAQITQVTCPGGGTPTMIQPSGK